VTSSSIVLIGAGSTVFTPGLMADLVGNPTFAGWTVHLVDLNPEAADVMARVGRRMAQARGVEMTFVPHTDRREALPGARIVTTTVAVGAAEGWRLDLEVPAAYGIVQTVGDSVGPGGVLRALRHVPELVAIARDVADLAPEAQLVNYSNPLTANVRGVTAETPVATIGLCHGTMHTLAKLNADLGLADRADEVHAVFAGLNHLCWLLDYRLGTEDLYPRLAALVDERAGGRDAPTSVGEGVHLPVSADLLRTFGRYPAPGDRHVAEFFGGYLRGADGSAVDDAHLPWGLQQGRDDTIRYIGQKADLWERLHDQADGRVPVEPGRGGQEAERLVSIAEALVTGREHVELAVNLPNRGLVPNLPPEAVVEVPAVVGAAGVTGLGVGPLPAGIAAVLSARAQQQELTVQAALRGDRALAVQALALDPLVPGPDVARAILDDAVRAHATLAAFAPTARPTSSPDGSNASPAPMEAA
jgi:alpha-galactosidase